MRGKLLVSLNICGTPLNSCLPQQTRKTKPASSNIFYLMTHFLSIHNFTTQQFIVSVFHLQAFHALATHLRTPGDTLMCHDATVGKHWPRQQQYCHVCGNGEFVYRFNRQFEKIPTLLDGYILVPHSETPYSKINDIMRALSTPPFKNTELEFIEECISE